MARASTSAAWPAWS